MRTTVTLDPDVESLREYDDIELLTPPFNLGHQRAIVFGLRATKHRFRATDYIVTMDSDGEDRPQDVVELLRVLTTRVGRLDAVVIARRTKRTEPMLFRFLYAGFLVLFRVLTGTTIRSGNFAALRGDPSDGLPGVAGVGEKTAASLLRETMWSMVSEVYSTVDFDYTAYTAENLRRFEAAYATYLTIDRA